METNYLESVTRQFEYYKIPHMMNILPMSS
jgi:hypothetical protein